jgi:hypothetical protein
VFSDKTWGGVCISFSLACFEIFQVICLQLRSQAKDASPLGHVLRKKGRELSPRWNCNLGSSGRPMCMETLPDPGNEGPGKAVAAA